MGTECHSLKKVTGSDTKRVDTKTHFSNLPPVLIVNYARVLFMPVFIKVVGNFPLTSWRNNLSDLEIQCRAFYL